MTYWTIESWGSDYQPANVDMILEAANEMIAEYAKYNSEEEVEIYSDFLWEEYSQHGYLLRSLEQMPSDRLFDGKWCHATGAEILYDDEDSWWTQYRDEDGNLYYG